MTVGAAFHPRLVEESVLAAMRAHPERRAFDRERERVYEETAGEAREEAFDRFHARWFERLGLGGPVGAAFAERRADLSGVGRVLAGPASSPRSEGVELFVNEAGERSVIISLTGERLAAGGSGFLAFLRMELLHIADMLDPSFGYEPRLPAHPCGPAHDRRRQQRYKALWDTSVAGRLAAAGLVESQPARSAALEQLRRECSGVGEPFERLFDRMFAGPRPTHSEFVVLASEPLAGAASALAGSSAASAAATAGASVAGVPAGDGPAPLGPRPDRCPLCGFPTVDFEPDSGSLGDDALAWIAADFPGWTPADGLCPQCADLYRARGMSLAALAVLPGIR